MRHVKPEKALWAILITAPLMNLLIPPYLAAYFFNLYNLNPFHIAPLPHFNPFKSGRGIPLSQTFSYLLVIWLIFNVLIGGGAIIIYHLLLRQNRNK